MNVLFHMVSRGVHHLIRSHMPGYELRFSNRLEPAVCTAFRRLLEYDRRAGRAGARCCVCSGDTMTLPGSYQCAAGQAFETIGREHLSSLIAELSSRAAPAGPSRTVTLQRGATAKVRPGGNPRRGTPRSTVLTFQVIKTSFECILWTCASTDLDLNTYTKRKAAPLSGR